MPLKDGKLTPRERNFVAIMSRVNDAVYAHAKAGYRGGENHAYEMAGKLQELTFAETQRLLKEKGSAVGVYVLIDFALNEDAPAGIRVTAAKELMKGSGVMISDQETDKEPHEMTSAELARYRDKMERQLDAINQAAADRAKPVLDARQESNPKSSVFG